MNQHSLLMVAALILATTSARAETIDVSQKGRHFVPETMTIKVGDTLRFRNDDMFLHHVYVNGPGLSFDSEEQPPGNVLEVKFPRAGDFTVRCRIHPKMRLDVHVGE